MVEPYDNPLLRHARRQRDRAVVALFRPLVAGVVATFRAAATAWIERVRLHGLLRELYKLRAIRRPDEDVTRLIAELEDELARERRLTRPSTIFDTASPPPARTAPVR